VWEAIKSRQIGVQRVRDANAEQLRKDFDNIRFKDGEMVDDFSMRLTGLMNNIVVLGGKITESEIMKKIYHVALEPLEQVSISIEMLFDLDNLSVEPDSYSPKRIGVHGRVTATMALLAGDPVAKVERSNRRRKRMLVVGHLW
jgi:hypothetical protein